MSQKYFIFVGQPQDYYCLVVYMHLQLHSSIPNS